MTVERTKLLQNPYIQCYISCGCNRTVDCLDWGGNNLVCFASCNSIAIYDPSIGAGEIVGLLHGHTNRVNSVRWIRSYDSTSETELVATSSDKSASVWSLRNGEFVKTAHLKGHSLTVNLGDGIALGQDGSKCHVATASADCSVKLWYREQLSDEFSLADTLSLGRNISVALRLTYTLGKVILALALDDCNVHLYCEGQRFISLTGHQDWVRAIAFSQSEGENEIVLATGGQDASIRVWKVTEDKTINDWKETLETTIHGHEGWINGLLWDKSTPGKRLMSCSLDRTVIAWEPGDSEIWTEEAVFGELGGNTLGFVSLALSPLGTCILAASFQGALHKWTSDEKGHWTSVGCVSGHFDSVESVAWEAKRGRYLLSGSLDQTTRLHAPVTATQDGRWYELNRPQVHGHAVWFLCPLPGHRFASVAEEKVIRVFSATSNSMQNLLALNNSFKEEEKDGLEAVGAAVPSLGLSNKAVTQTDLDAEAKNDGPRHANEEYINSYFVPIHLSDIPTEDTLQQNSLWVEIKKLYGHGYEVFTLAATNSGNLLASACKATTAEHAAIILWDTSSWQEIGRIVAHSLTVTRMQFSPDDTKLLSVSRDRQWILSTQQDDGSWAVVKCSEKTTNPHSRIIWCCSWSPSGDSFVTSSRDGHAAIWNKDGELSGQPLKLGGTSITAVATANGKQGLIVALGTEGGDVFFYTIVEDHWHVLLKLPSQYKGSLCIKQLAFRPKPEDEDWLELAVASQDYSVRIVKFNYIYYEQQMQNPVKI